MKSGLQRAQWQAQRAGDLIVGQSLHFAHHDDGSVRFRKAPEGVAHLRDHLSAELSLELG